MPSNSHKRKEIAPFLKSLWHILSYEDQNIIRWLPDGLAFEITSRDKLVEHILPKYFRHSNFTSFQRQLNYFGFKKWSKSKTKNCIFSSENFTKHDKSALAFIRRRSNVKVCYSDLQRVIYYRLSQETEKVREPSTLTFLCIVDSNNSAVVGRIESHNHVLFVRTCMSKQALAFFVCKPLLINVDQIDLGQ